MHAVLQIAGLVALVVGAYLVFGVGVAVLIAGLAATALGIALERQTADRRLTSEAARLLDQRRNA